MWGGIKMWLVNRRSGLIIVMLLLIVLNRASALDISVTPGMSIPLGPTQGDGTKIYTFGGGADVTAEYIFPSVPILYTEALVGYDLMGTVADSNLSLVSVGAGTGLTFKPLPIFDIRTALAGGYAVSLLQDATGSNLFVKANVTAFYNPIPILSVGLGLSYKHYWQLPDFGASDAAIMTLYNGLGVFLGSSIHIGALHRKSLLEMRKIEIYPVFPVFYKHYETNPVGMMKLFNDEPAAIRDVQASFFVPQYMDKPIYSQSIEEIGRGEELTVPLYALFTDNILQVTEGTKASAEIRVEYTLTGSDMETALTQTLLVYYRNAMTWDDDRKAASFVTAKDPAVLKYAKAIGGLARAEGNPAVNLPFRKAMGIFESLGLYGMKYVIDPNSSYDELSQSDTALDYLQFPIQTLTYRAGDCDDLSILYSALLEAVGVETAFVTVPGHIYVAFALDLSQEDSSRLFSNREDLIFQDNDTWIPVEITMIDEGFLAAWRQGAKQWRENRTAETAAFFPIREAWSTYPPTGIIERDSDVTLPDLGTLTPRYTSTLDHFVELQIKDRTLELQEEIRKNNNPRLINKLGVLYARFGLYDKAKNEFQRAASANNLSAMVNLGNLYYIDKDLQRAVGQFERALELDPDNPAVLLGLAKANYELENYGSVKDFYSRLQAQNPQLASKFAYLTQKQTDTARAADISMPDSVLWDE